MSADWAALASVLDQFTAPQATALLRIYRLGIEAGVALSDAGAPPVPVGPRMECDWEHGVACCPGCGAVIQVVARQSKPPRVTDGDGREHYCQRQIAAALAAHGEPGMGPFLQRHAERGPIAAPVVARPTTAPQQPAPWERWQ